MARPRSEDALFAEAFDLAIALQDEPTPARVTAARDWRARSPAHAAVWAQVSEIHGMTGRIFADRRRAERGLSRRGFMAAAALGLGAAGAWRFAPGLIARARADAATGTAEISRLALPDGTEAVLAPETALGFDFAPDARGVTLLAGLGYFKVAPRPGLALPFVVRGRGAPLAEARDAEFEVEETEGARSLAVARGRVSLPGSGETLGAGEVARWRDSGGVAITHRPAAQVAGWRGGVAIAEEETVSALVARIARWRAGPVLVAPGLAGRRVSGVFDLGAPEAALEAVVRPLGGRARRIGPRILLSAG